MQTGRRVRSVIQIHREGLFAVVSAVAVVDKLVVGKDNAWGRKADKGNVVVVVADDVG